MSTPIKDVYFKSVQSDSYSLSNATIGTFGDDLQAQISFATTNLTDATAVPVTLSGGTQPTGLGIVSYDDGTGEITFLVDGVYDVTVYQQVNITTATDGNLNVYSSPSSPNLLFASSLIGTGDEMVRFDSGSWISPVLTNQSITVDLTNTTTNATTWDIDVDVIMEITKLF